MFSPRFLGKQTGFSYTRKIGNYNPRKRKKMKFQKKKPVGKQPHLSLCEILFSLGIGFFKKPLFPCVWQVSNLHKWVGVFFFILEWRLYRFRNPSWPRIKDRQELRVAVFVEVTVSSCFLRVDKCGLVVSEPICVQPNWTLTVTFLCALHFKKNQSFVLKILSKRYIFIYLRLDYVSL